MSAKAAREKVGTPNCIGTKLIRMILMDHVGPMSLMITSHSPKSYEMPMYQFTFVPLKVPMYERRSDTKKHLNTYKTLISLKGALPTLKCKSLPSNPLQRSQKNGIASSNRVSGVGQTSKSNSWTNEYPRMKDKLLSKTSKTIGKWSVKCWTTT